MTDRAELVEAALGVYSEGLALLDVEERLVFWNRAAELMTGYCAADLVGRPIPDALQPLTTGRDDLEAAAAPDNGSGGGTRSGPRLGRGALVHAQHKLGHDVPAVVRRVVLRGALGKHIGTAAMFHAGEQLAALPHGETSDGAEVRQSQLELEDRLAVEFEASVHEGVALGVLWISVDQARDLRKTHGARACETMLETVERALANGLGPGEEVGRWGDDEFLVVSHAASADVLARHGEKLAGMARTADFRWWGDRVSVTVSVGAAAAEADETLAQLLERAQSAMQASAASGGNHVTPGAGRQPCSRS